MLVLAWGLMIAAVIGGVRALQRRETASTEEAKAAAAHDRRRWLTAALGCLAAGVVLLIYTNVASARLSPVDLSGGDDWVNFPSEGNWEWDGRTLSGTLEPNSEAHALIPVDWEGDAFHAEWDLTVQQLDVFADRDRASIAIGLFDQSGGNIDDRDHVGGSGLQACFSDDVRLRSSDTNHLLRTSSSTESGERGVDAAKFEPSEKIAIQLGETYHCVLEYSSRTQRATLEVTDSSGRSLFASGNPRYLNELENFTSNVAWFGVSTRGYKLFDKNPDDPDYAKPKAVFEITNIAYEQS